jgi:TRAP-type C4-dicarboxylate transport system permease small subunit
MLRRANAVFSAFEAGAITVLLGVLFLANFYALTMRYFFRSYPPWIIEVSECLLVSLVFLGGSWLYREGRQIAVLIFLNMLHPDRLPGRLVRMVGEIIVLGFALLVLWQAARYQTVLFQSRTPVLGLPKNITTILVPVAYFSIVLASLERLMFPAGSPR